MHTTAFAVADGPFTGAGSSFNKPLLPRAATDIGISKEMKNEGFTITSAEDLEYFAEGKSNVLYKYIGEDDELKPRLLRFRKSSPTLSKTITTQEIHANLQSTFTPLLFAYVVRTELCSISPGVVKSLNANRKEGGGEKNGLLDETEEYALAVEDMSPGIYQKHNEISHGRMNRRRRQFPFLSPRGSGTSLASSAGEESEPGSQVNSGYNSEAEDDDEPRKKWKKGKLPIPNKRDLDPARLSRHNWRDLLTVKFTPGGLLQPDRAPPGWSVCRDCAVRHMDSATTATTSRHPTHSSHDSGASDCSDDSSLPQPPPYCPLSLVSADPSRVKEAVESVIAGTDTVSILDEQEVIVNDPALGMEGISPWLDVLEYSIADILAGYFYDGGSIGRVVQELQRRGGKEEFDALRRCKLYVRLWMRCKEDEERNYEVHIECKVGGLDVGEGKDDGEEEKVQEKLIRGGWYLGRGQGVDGKICRE